MKSSHGVIAGLVACGIAALAAWWWDSAPAEHAPDGEFAITAHAGFDGAPPVAALDETAPDSEPSVELSDGDDALGRAELETTPVPAVAVPAGPSALLRGSMRDENTGDALPFFLLRAHDRAHNEDLVTDAAGQFASATPFLIGRVRIDPLDHAQRRRPVPSLQVDHELDEGEPRELALSVASGPTFMFAFTPAGEAPLETLRATLFVRDDEDQQSVGGEPLRVGSVPARVTGDDASSSTVFTDAYALPWVRFGPVPEPFERAERLEIRDAAGVWTGDARVVRTAGVEHAPVNVKLAGLASLRGRVVDESGAPVERALVELRPADAATKAKPRTTNADGDGRYHFDFVPPGNWIASFKTLRHLVQEAPAVLAPKTVATLDAALAPKPAVGAIRGEVVTQSGTSTPKARITLTLPRGDRSLPPLSTDVVWTTVEGRKVGRFEFPALPEGPLQLRVDKSDWFTWEPAKFEVAPPREGLRILVYDDIATCDYAVRVRDRDNGLALERLHVWLEFEGGPTRDRRTVSNEIFERGVPVGRKFRWRVDRAGYGFAAGDESAFALEEHRDGRIVRVAELDLAPGWSELVRTVRRDGRAIAGAEVFADGVSAGKTDDAGYLKLVLRDPPKRLEAKHADFTAQGRPDLQSAWKRDQRRFLPLTMAPVRRDRKPAAKR